jgi:hypothetical protein
MIDSSKSAESTANRFGYVKTATANITFRTGFVGVIADGNVHGHIGTPGDTYVAGEDLNIVKRGVVHMLIDTTDDNVQTFVRDCLVAVGANGRAKKWVMPTITPDMTATLSADPSNTEVAAYVAEYTSEYQAAYAAAVESIIGRVVGDPDDTTATVAVELYGVPSFQE